MKKLTLVCFEDCPHIQSARYGIRNAGFDIEEFSQEKLPKKCDC